MQIDGERMRLRRLELRLSQEKLAERTGISQSVIAKLENGKLKGRAREQQETIARELGMSVQELCGQVPAAAAQEPSGPTGEAPRDAGAIDDALASAWNPAAHRLVDVLVVRLLLMAGRDEPEGGQVRALLSAAAALRARGVTATPSAVALEVARGRHAVSPSADAKPTTKPAGKKSNAA